jgi:hypothetical protein
VTTLPLPFFPLSLLCPCCAVQSVSLACIYLAGKVRDSPKALTVVMQAGEHYRHRALNKDPTNPPKPWDDVVSHAAAWWTSCRMALQACSAQQLSCRLGSSLIAATTRTNSRSTVGTFQLQHRPLVTASVRYTLSHKPSQDSQRPWCLLVCTSPHAAP